MLRTTYTPAQGTLCERTTVVNVRRMNLDVTAVYIGRGSIYGNPFTHLAPEQCRHQVIQVENREKAVGLYRSWLLEQEYRDLEPARRQAIIKSLPELRGRYLACYCAPQSCHGDVLAGLAEAEFVPRTHRVIEAFDGDYRFLSNFWLCPVQFDGRSYRCVEAAYQAAKTEDPALRESFCPLTGAQAKHAGKRLSLRLDWPQVKIRIMRDLLHQKFSEPGLRRMLLATGDAQLVEGNAWHDSFWGVCCCSMCSATTQHNHLGVLLMELRAELRKA